MQSHVHIAEQALADHVDLATAAFLSRRTIEANRAG